MRPKGLIVLAVVLLIVGAIMYFVTDDLIEQGIESAGTSAVGAKVEIDNLVFSLFTLSVSMDRLQVTNPNDTWKNMFETGRLAFDMEVAPLLRKKVIINEVAAENIRLGTRRSTDGAIPIEETEDTEPGWFDDAKKDLENQIAQAPVLQLGALRQKVNVDSIIATFDIQSIQKIEAFRTSTLDNYNKWHDQITNFKPQNDFAKLEDEVKAITSADMNNVQQVTANLDRAKKTYDQLTSLKSDLNAQRQTFAQDFASVTSAFSEVDNWISDDFGRIKSKANLGEFTPQNIGKMLFGDVLKLPTLSLLEYVDWAREYMPAAQKVRQVMQAGKVEKPPRFEGQDIEFPLTHRMPKFLLEKISLSAASNQADTSQVIRVSGDVLGITTDPKLYGKPLTFKLDARPPGTNAYDITGSFDHTGEIPKDQIQIRASNLHIGKMDLPQKPYVPALVNIDRGNVKANLDFIGDQLDFKLTLDATPVDFVFDETTRKQDVIADVTRSVFDSIDNLQVTATFAGLIGDFKLHIGSNIDNILADRITKVIGESVRLARAELERQFYARVEPKKKEAEALVNKYRTELDNQLQGIEKEIDEKMALLDTKKQELEARVEKEKEKGIGEVKKKVGDLLKR
jgi:uncharacterized protein (TIGR03545 family)